MSTIPVFFMPEQVAPEQEYSPSAQKPEYVMAEWQKREYPIETHAFTKTATKAFWLAHDRVYVRDVLECREPNGFGTISKEVAASLPYTTGSMVAAARNAFATRSVSVSPTSGFHHACWSMGGGFCTFNGLVVAARTLVETDRARKVAILDCDQHYGDGTDNILSELNDRGVPLYDRIHHVTLGKFRYKKGEGDKYLRSVRAALSAFKTEGVEVVLYQAGADPHVNDPLGGVLTSEELRKRDAIVFEWAKEHRVGIAWNLAGGYQRTETGSIQPVLDIHNATMDECVRVFGGAK